MSLYFGGQNATTVKAIERKISGFKVEIINKSSEHGSLKFCEGDHSLFNFVVEKTLIFTRY